MMLEMIILNSSLSLSLGTFHWRFDFPKQFSNSNLTLEALNMVLSLAKVVNIS